MEPTHYHIFSGKRGSKNPTCLKFKDRMEGITTFISMTKVLFNYLETPPAFEQLKINEKMSVIRIQDRLNRIIFAYCNNTCDDDDVLDLKLNL